MRAICWCKLTIYTMCHSLWIVFILKDAVCKQKKRKKKFILVILTLRTKWLMNMVGATCSNFSNSTPLSCWCYTGNTTNLTIGVYCIRGQFTPKLKIHSYSLPCRWKVGISFFKSTYLELHSKSVLRHSAK